MADCSICYRFFFLAEKLFSGRCCDGQRNSFIQAERVERWARFLATRMKVAAAVLRRSFIYY